MRFYPLPEGSTLDLPQREGWVMVFSPGTSILRLPDTLPDSPIVLFGYTSGGRVEMPANYRDLTERMRRGPIRMYRTDFLKRIGAEAYGRVWEYYAFLSLYAEGGRHAVVGDVIAEGPPPEDYGRLHSEAFKYLLYGGEYEREVERVFLSFLKRVGAYLPRPLGYPLKVPPHSPKVSVITPVKDRADFIGEAIESVLANDFGDWEMIVVDNGSRDGTPEVVERYARRDRRIKLVRTAGKSLTECLNIGVRESRGWIVAQLDSDDTYTPWALRSIYEYHRENPVGLAISYYEVVDERGERIEEMPVVKHLEFSINNLLRVEGAGAVRAYRREVLERLGGFNEELTDFGEDYDLVLRISELYPVGRIHSVLYRYRRHAGSTDATRDYHSKARTKTAVRWAAIHRRRLLNFVRRPSLP